MLPSEISVFHFAFAGNSVFRQKLLDSRNYDFRSIFVLSCTERVFGAVQFRRPIEEPGSVVQSGRLPKLLASSSGEF